MVPKPRWPDIPGLEECMAKRRRAATDPSNQQQPRYKHNCWNQLGRGHTNGWLTDIRCECEDLLICWQELRPNTYCYSQLNSDWYHFCKSQYPGDPATMPQ